MSLSELNHRKTKRDERTNFEKAAVSPPPFRSDLSFWPFFPNGISFVGKFLTSFGLIISLYKSLNEKTAGFQASSLLSDILFSESWLKAFS